MLPSFWHQDTGEAVTLAPTATRPHWQLQAVTPRWTEGATARHRKHQQSLAVTRFDSLSICPVSIVRPCVGTVSSDHRWFQVALRFHQSSVSRVVQTFNRAYSNSKHAVRETLVNSSLTRSLSPSAIYLTCKLLVFPCVSLALALGNECRARLGAETRVGIKYSSEVGSLEYKPCIQVRQELY